MPPFAVRAGVAAAVGAVVAAAPVVGAGALVAAAPVVGAAGAAVGGAEVGAGVGAGAHAINAATATSAINTIKRFTCSPPWEIIDFRFSDI